METEAETERTISSCLPAKGTTLVKTVRPFPQCFLSFSLLHYPLSIPFRLIKEETCSQRAFPNKEYIIFSGISTISGNDFFLLVRLISITSLIIIHECDSYISSQNQAYSVKIKFMHFHGLWTWWGENFGIWILPEIPYNLNLSVFTSPSPWIQMELNKWAIKF